MKKTMAIAAFAVSLIACGMERNIQVKTVNVELVRVDTIQRADNMEKLLTWETSSRMRYYSIEHINNHYAVGTSMMVLVTK